MAAALGTLAAQECSVVLAMGLWMQPNSDWSLRRHQTPRLHRRKVAVSPDLCIACGRCAELRFDAVKRSMLTP